MMRWLSLRNVDDKKNVVVPFKGVWYDLMREPDQSGCWIIYGKSGQGKTSFMMQLARELDEMKYRVVIISLEEGIRSTFRDALHSNGIVTGMHKINVSTGASAEELDEWLGTTSRPPSFVFIDSVQYWSMEYKATAAKIIELRKKYESTVFVFTSHVQGSEVEGTDAYWVKRDSFCRIEVEGFTAKYIGRGPGGQFTIWKEGAEEYYLANMERNKTKKS